MTLSGDIFPKRQEAPLMGLKRGLAVPAGRRHGAERR